MKSRYLTFAGGLFAGILLTAGTLWITLPQAMIRVHNSPLDFEQTVTTIRDSITAHGWVQPKVYNIQKSLDKEGYKGINRIKVLSLCQPGYAYEILSKDSNKRVSALMPCRISIYETSQGEVRVAEVNTGLMSRLFGGKIEEVMAKASGETRQILAESLAN
ncbi:DUF302 domain-containing protein [endosymbiont of Ridgeia piscesae]|jgi:uncharacterized protein (DUF302 family)|uniref:Uncharacterized conserved protein, DUF302 family n=1 Tax=endosymbiont of Ridgeia piscesae TaxID=54398 RepID=A0A0T5YTZ5_9GAMM|nr:DUF302 domain-containing protein [endosymbiont of Ridgeia piscesae]KRT53758.1 hypothetical protein Ga0074115_10193 [endosymbiont of Ridgeia piscesae]KRT58560.1 Uncharacterized conserved protein, DUF302 family [endosymbiont of Ridgeia piscesae]